MAKHAKLSPSGASRWLTCTAAPALEAGFKDKPSEFAEEGTFAHELAELESGFALDLITKSTYTRRLNKLKKDSWFSQDMHDFTKDYANYIKETFLASQEKCEDCFAELEVKLDLTDYVPEGFGTADCIIVADETLNVIDFKYGKGVKVSAENNSQMKLYALGALAAYGVIYDITQIRMTIVQPRLNSVEVAELSAKDLIDWGENTVRPNARKAYDGEGEYAPSESACRFCKAAGACRARADMMIGLFDENPEPKLLTADEAGKILLKASGMKAWLTALEATVFDGISAGELVEDWKIVEGRSNRKYADEDKVAAQLKKAGYEDDKIFTKKLITITAVEKLLGKKNAGEILKGLIIKPKGAPTLAEISDKREALNLTEETLKAFNEE